MQEDLVSGTDRLHVFYGQLLARGKAAEHSLCDGEENSYKLQGLSIELEIVCIVVVEPGLYHQHRTSGIKILFTEQFCLMFVWCVEEFILGCLHLTC